MRATMKTITICLLLLVVTASAAWAGNVPKVINYQGKLTDPSGIAITNPSVNMIFRIYNAASGGSQLWSETQTVTVTDGVFNVLLGSVNSLNLTFDSQYYLSIQIAGDPAPLSPRHRLSTSPYAYYAQQAATVDNNAITSGKIRDGEVGNNDLAGNAVSSAKIANGGVLTQDLADNAVDVTKLSIPVKSSRYGHCTTVNGPGVGTSYTTLIRCSISLPQSSWVLVNADADINLFCKEVSGSALLYIYADFAMKYDGSIFTDRTVSEITSGQGVVSFGISQNASMSRMIHMSAGNHTVEVLGRYRDHQCTNPGADFYPVVNWVALGN